jgi:hypothetical protein
MVPRMSKASRVRDQPVITAGVPVELDDVNEQTKCGGDVLLVRIPRPADMAGGAEGRLAQPLEVRHRVAPARAVSVSPHLWLPDTHR